MIVDPSDNDERAAAHLASAPKSIPAERLSIPLAESAASDLKN